MKTHYRLYDEDSGFFWFEQFDSPEEAFSRITKPSQVVIKFEQVQPSNPF